MCNKYYQVKVAQLDFKEEEGIVATAPFNAKVFLHPSFCLKSYFNPVWTSSLIVNLPTILAREATTMTTITIMTTTTAKITATLFSTRAAASTIG